MTITTTHLIKSQVKSLRRALFSVNFALMVSCVVFTLDISLDVHVASAEEVNSSVKLTARKVSGDVKASRRLFKKLLNRGRQLTRKKQYEASIDAYQEALTYDPNNAQALGELGFTAHKMKRFKLAENLARLCVRQSQSNKIKGSCYYNLGRALESQSDKEGAARAYAESLRVRPGNKAVKQRLASLNVKPEIAESPACLGVACEPLDWKSVCPHLNQITAEKLGLGDPSESRALCSKVGGRDVNEPLLKSVALARVEVMGEALYFVVFKVESGWVPAGIVGYSYNPGAFGIYEDVTLNVALRDIIGGDQASELIVHTTINHHDSDMGIEEEESSEVALEHICGIESEGLRARCYGPLLRSRTYQRDYLGEGRPSAKKGSKLPINQTYSASLMYPAAGVVEVKSVKGTFKGVHLKRGTYQITALPKTEVSIYTR